MDVLNKYIIKHQQMFDIAYSEIKNGKKTSHWMWYIFPQIIGLGSSNISRYYAINNINEAYEYFDNDYLRNNYITLCELLINLDINNPVQIFGEVDALKLHSSLTLFYKISNNEIIYKVLEKYYNKELDEITLKKLTYL